MKKKVLLLLFIVVAFFQLGLFSGKPADQPSSDKAPHRYIFKIPASTPFIYEPPNNITTYEGVALGKKLFFDSRLSKNYKISCASCHHPDMMFSDTATFSLGFEGKSTLKNSMPLINLGWKPRYFWDGRVSSLEDLIKFPMEHPDEMGLAMDSAVSRVKNDEQYPKMFAAAFPGEQLNKETLAKALAQYLRTLTSFESRLDSLYQDYSSKGVNVDGRHSDFLGLTQNTVEVLAFCERCHSSVTYGGTKFTNNGLPDDGDGTRDEDSIFVAPTLRNIGFTGPYMHDGRFKTLEEVLVHYTADININPNLDTLLISNGKPKRFSLNATEKQQLIHFLTYYLTDTKNTHD
jgi:cytochrome c peroxidase